MISAAVAPAHTLANTTVNKALDYMVQNWYDPLILTGRSWMVILFNSRMKLINYSDVNTLEQIEGIVPPCGNTRAAYVHNYNTRRSKTRFMPKKISLQ